MGKKGVKVMGGVVDFGYSNEVLVMLNNLSDDDVIIQAGDKIAQFVILPVPLAQIVEVDKLEDSERGEKGFGSSGR
jgi:dUTP pyrophosphatase